MPDIKFTPVDEIPTQAVRRGAPPKFTKVFEYLRANPGATVKLDGKYSHTLVTKIKRGEVSGCEAGEFFATCRNTNNWKADIYITYVGPKPNEDFHERTVAL